MEFVAWVASCEHGTTAEAASILRSHVPRGVFGQGSAMDRGFLKDHMNRKTGAISYEIPNEVYMDP